VLAAVAVVDAGGDPVQLDRMDGGVVGAIDIAVAVASASARFGRPTDGGPGPGSGAVLAVR